MKTRRTLATLAVLSLLSLGACIISGEPGKRISPPKPYGPVPSPRQLAWHKLEFYGFFHTTVNTFTDKEWGYGDESPDVFNPTDFDPDQIVGTAKAAGMKGVILTAKHHDGFCLWPSKYTKHSVKYSKWMNGKGDFVGAIARSCRKFGLKFGIYLSPWDRNHPDYGRPAYVTYYKNQLRELLTNYGPVFEIWFDGANGGTGYYGGARERRTIDRSTYYGWPKIWAMVRRLQPMACMFSDVGPDIRWVGNERGYAGDPCWATYTPHSKIPGKAPAPGLVRFKEGLHGHRHGKYWMPAEVDVSIRPGWFYHPSQDSKVKSPQTLVKIYFQSVGRGASLLLNVPPDRRGRIHEQDVKSLMGFRRILDRIFEKDLARGARVIASNVRGNSPRFAPENVLDQDRDTYWCCDDGVTAPALELRLPRKATFDVVDLREYLPLGQRIDTWALDAWKEGKWVEFAKGEAIGNRRLWRGGPVTTTRVRLRLTGPVCPALSDFHLYKQP